MAEGGVDPRAGRGGRVGGSEAKNRLCASNQPKISTAQISFFSRGQIVRGWARAPFCPAAPTPPPTPKTREGEPLHFYGVTVSPANCCCPPPTALELRCTRRAAPPNCFVNCQFLRLHPLENPPFAPLLLDLPPPPPPAPSSPTSPRVRSQLRYRSPPPLRWCFAHFTGAACLCHCLRASHQSSRARSWPSWRLLWWPSSFCWSSSSSLRSGSSPAATASTPWSATCPGPSTPLTGTRAAPAPCTGTWRSAPRHSPPLSTRRMPWECPCRMQQSPYPRRTLCPESTWPRDCQTILQVSPSFRGIIRPISPFPPRPHKVQATPPQPQPKAPQEPPQPSVAVQETTHTQHHSAKAPLLFLKRHNAWNRCLPQMCHAR